jgi:5-methylcytosine-specific restriction endonuclease McrA
MGYTVIKNNKRICILCRKEQDLSCFPSYKYKTQQNKTKIRYDSRCKPCGLELRKKMRLITKEQDKLNCKAWREKNAAYVRDCAKKYRQSIDGKAKRAELQRIREKNILINKSDKEEREKIRSFYVLSKDLFRKTGVLHHVDHIIPLSKGGIHHSSNLQVIPAAQNLKKGSKL